MDRRELILVRITEILEGLRDAHVADPDFPIRSAFRDRAPLEQDLRPALHLFDGLEDLGSPEGGYTTQRSAYARPAFMILKPQVWAVLQQRTPDKANEYGPLLSQFRVILIPILLEDTQLKTLVSSNGKIAYLGLETDMQTGSSMEGQLHMKFAFTYPLITGEL